jgi:glycerol-3-phosphate dehydrogenase
MVEVLPFLIPILTKDGVVSRKIAKALGSALWMYDLTGGWRIGKFHRRLGAEQAAEHFPTAHLDRLSGGYLYYDATADDARLTLTIARTAARHGAVVVNRCRLVGLDRVPADRVPDDRAPGNAPDRAGITTATIDVDGERVTVAARAVVNATGVWADGVRALDESADPGSIRPAKGVHITLPWSLVRNDIAVIIPVRRDKRSLFLVPWGETGDGTFRHVYVGTTDTDDQVSLDEPRADGDDIVYLLDALNEALDTSHTDRITSADITGVWAGLRPLVKTTIGDSGASKDLSRRHHVHASDTGVVTVTGGKLTTYREMAADAVDAALRFVPTGSSTRAPSRVSTRASTRRLKLLGATSPAGASATLTDRHLVRRYGSLVDEIRALIAFDATLGEPLVAGLPYLRAEVVYAVRSEMATTLDDVVLRRTRAHLADRHATLDAAPSVAALMQAELGWDDAETARQLDHYRTLCAAEEIAGDHVADASH